jgi:uncharacterized protein (TIGR03437 family)
MNSSEQDAPILRASTGSVWALVPKDAPFGKAQVVLISGEQRSAPAQIDIVPAAVGLFAQDSSGIGPALAQNDSPSEAPVLNQLTNPARPGDYLTLWGTGLGQTSLRDISVEVGGMATVPSYAGPAPGYPGLDQINVPLPLEAPDGCYVAVQVRTGGSVSNTVSIAKSIAPGACAHPFGLSQTDLQSLDAGQAVRLGLLTMRSRVDPSSGSATTENTYTRNESAGLEMLLRMPGDIALLAQPQTTDEAYFRCALVNPSTLPQFLNAQDGDAGSPLTLQGPGKALSLTNSADLRGVYSSLLSPPAAVADPAQLPAAFLVPGAWQLTVPGGANFGPFQVSSSLPPPVRWTNRAALAMVDRSQDQTITWQPDGYSSKDVMTVSLSSSYFAQSLPGTYLAVGLTCRAPASAGKLTIPASLMRQMPPSPSLTNVPGGTLILQISQRPDRRAGFDMPQVGGGSARGLVDYQLGETLRTAIR